MKISGRYRLNRRRFMGALFMGSGAAVLARHGWRMARPNRGWVLAAGDV
jgi:hypothetical protein